MHGYCDTDTIVCENGHIGHGAILHGCVIGRDALVGMNSVIMDGAIIGEESIVAAMSFVKAGFIGTARQLLVGTPARFIREVTEKELQWKQLNTREYQDLTLRCRSSLYETQPLRQPEKPTTAERHNRGEAEISSMILSNGAPAPFDNRANGANFLTTSFAISVPSSVLPEELQAYEMFSLR
jgi:hypothetical protein